MKTISSSLKFLVLFIFLVFVTSCSKDESGLYDDDFSTEIEAYDDTIIIGTRTRVDDKDGD